MSSEFRSTTLGQIVTFSNGRSSPERFDDGKYPVFGSNGLIGKANETNAPGKSIVVGRVGSYCGSVHFSPQPCWVTDNAIKAAAKDSNNPEFLFYLLKHLDLNNWRSGSGQPLINQATLNAIEVCVPEPDEQREIGQFVGAIDDRITLLSETNATLEAIAQALFKSWFVDFDPVRAKLEGRAPESMDEATARLFPDSFEESELGMVPRGWRVGKFEDFIKRMSVGKKYDQKSASVIGTVPILDQGKSGVIGFHDEVPGVRASLDNPVVVFANHTCYMRLITFDFSAIQNVLPFVGQGVDTVWAFYATKDRVKFSEYKGHWPDFAIEKSVLPTDSLTSAFRGVVDPLMRSVRINELQAQTLTNLRDTLLPRLISGQLRLPEAQSLVEDLA
jgi:type I restriction enzyme, S subunit